MTSAELRARRAQVIAQSRELLNTAETAQRDFSAEEEAQWQRMNAEIDQLGARIERSEALARREAELAAAVANDPAAVRQVAAGSAAGDPGQAIRLPEAEARALAVQGWFLRNSDDDRAREQFDPDRHGAAQRQTGIGRNRRELRIPLACTSEGGFASSRSFARMRRQILSGMAWDAGQQQFVPRGSVHPLTSQTGSGGGVLVPDGFSGEFETALLAYGYILQTSDVMRTEGANPLPWPTANDTANMGRMLTQSAAVDNTGASTAYPSFGAVMFFAYKCTSDEVLVPFELIRDNAVGLVDWLAEALGIRIGRRLNDRCTLGSGGGEPMGLITAITNIAASAGIVTSAKAGQVQWDDLIVLEHAIDPAYRSNPGVGYMCHDSIILALRKLKDGEGRYLWQQSANSGEPDRLNNRPLTRNQSMSNAVATGNNVLVFGDLSKFKIRQVGDVRLYRLVERYRDNDQDAFLAFHEFDSNLVDAGTHPVKLLQVQ